MDRPPQRLDDYRTKTSLVYDTLREFILAGRFPPGSRIIVDQVAAELGTSKVPVREAVVQLVGEGWLKSIPHVGAVVPTLSADEILETAIIRAAVEGMAVRHSVDALTPEDLDGLRALLNQLDEVAKSGSASYPSLNFDFHTSVFRRCRYPALRALAASLAEKSLHHRPVRFLPEYVRESQAQHWALVAALERRDADEAERVVRHHIEHAGRLLWQYAQEQADTGKPRRASKAQR